MMPLKENEESTNKVEKVSGALSTEEIVSLLSKSNKDFIKESEISSSITNLFKKITPKILAKNNEDDDLKIKNETEKQAKEFHEEVKSQDIENKEKKDPVAEKKYTEAEAQKLANDYAKQYYNNGYKLGVKKTTEELQKGDKALAVTLKKTTDNIFAVTPDFSKKLTHSINKFILKITNEVLGYEIDNNNPIFQNKIKELVNSIERSVKDVQIYLNEQDLKSISDYNKQNNISFSYKLLPDSKLQRGDLRVRSGSIEVGDIVSNKINFSDSSDLDLTLKFDTNNDELSNQPKQKPNT